MVMRFRQNVKIDVLIVPLPALKMQRFDELQLKHSIFDRSCGC